MRQKSLHTQNNFDCQFIRPPVTRYGCGKWVQHEEGEISVYGKLSFLLQTHGWKAEGGKVISPEKMEKEHEQEKLGLDEKR